MIKNYNKLKSKLEKIADLNNAISVLHWDQEVNLPENASGIRARQLATLSGLAHEQFVSNEMGDLLGELSNKNGLDDRQSANVKETLKEFDKKKKLPKVFVEKMSESVSKAYFAWNKAKEASDFKLFENELKDLVDMSVEKAELLGFEDHIYDALLDEYEPGLKVKEVSVIFEDVKKQLVDFVAEIATKPQLKDAWLYKSYNKEKQWNLGIDLLNQMGYDFKSGRQDLSSHPFTTSFGPSDVRVTTRIKENDFNEMIWSCIHEGGHALYEQGLLLADYGMPTGEAISLGIHESQSRLYENNIGRSLPYWKHNYTKLQQLFPANLGAVSVTDFYRSINKVTPSLIRTGADELTYHFHILIRFEIERDLIEGSIAVGELPEVWNEKYKQYLNITVPNDAQGVLQDIHWSHGSFGYFPTYSIGSFYAAQFFDKAKEDMPNLITEIEQGKLLNLLTWLREHIHQYGKQYSADELCKKVTGSGLNFEHFMNYAKEKYGYIYNM